MNQDNLRMNFKALNAYFNNSSLDPLGSIRRPAQAGIKEGYLLKKWSFYRY